MNIKVNDSKDPVAEQDSLLVQVDYANQPIPNNRLPKGLYYSFKDKWVDMITLLTPAIKKIVTANTTVPAWGSITGTLSNQSDLQDIHIELYRFFRFKISWILPSFKLHLR